MAFGKKKKNNAEAPQETRETKGSVIPKKPKKSPLAGIFQESVLETVLEELRNNDQCIQTVDGKRRYIALVLDTEKIGGLDKKSRKDEAKGSIIECIRSGNIKTFITPELMDINSIVIIPDPQSLSAMDDFALLTDTKYELCAIDDNGDIALLGVEVTYQQIAELIAGDGHINSILGDDDDDDDDIDDDYEDEDEDSDSMISGSDSNSDADIIDDDEDIPDAEEDDSVYQRPEPESDFVDSPAVPAYDAPAAAEAAPAQTGDYAGNAGYAETGYNDAGVADPYSQEMLEEQQEEPEGVIPPEWSDAAVTRRFYSEDLGLEVSPEPFNAQFLADNPYVPFEENRPEGWINDQLNEMSRAANLEMDKLHRDNLWVMRERYFRLMAMQCERIRDDLDIHNPTTQYGALYMQLQKGHQDQLNHIDQDASVRKTAMERAWHLKLQDVGMDAARAAQAAYKAKYAAEHDQQIYDIDRNLKAEYDEAFQEDVHEMHARRRTEAASLLDLGITEVLSEISDMYVSALSDERVRYQELQEEMRAFVNDNREADIARSRALMAELRQKERADTVLAEQTAKIRNLTNEFSQRKRDLEAQIDRIRSENDARLADVRSDGEAAVARIQAEKDDLQGRFNDLLAQYRNLDDKKAQEYEGRMEELKDEISSWETRCNHLMDVHKKNNLVSTFLLIAALIAALTIGFIGGERIRIGGQMNQVRQSINEAYSNGSSSGDDGN